MKITKDLLKRLIKEEVQKTLTEDKDKMSEYVADARKRTDKSLASTIKVMHNSNLNDDGKLRLRVFEREAVVRFMSNAV